MPNAIREIWRGDQSLKTVFWVYGVLASFAFFVFLYFDFVALLPRDALGVAIAASLVFSVYIAVVSVGIWRSAARYAGTRAWAVSSRVFVLFAGAVGLLLLILGAAGASFYAKGSARNSHTVAATIVHDPTHPYAGFWKTDCTNQFGFAIEGAGPSQYSIVFCGPSGCFPPGSYRPNTSLAGDPQYRLIDANTIEILSREGFMRVVRCQ